MRILHIIGTMDPASGGPSEVVRMLAEHAPAGFTTEIVTIDPPGAAFLKNVSFPVHALGTPKNRWFAPRLLPWLRANRHRFDAAIVHGLWEYTGLAARRAFTGHLPYAVFPHGMLDPWFKRNHPLKHAKKWLYWHLVERWNLRRAQHVLFTTTAERDLARHTFGRAHWDPIVVPLGAEMPTADPLRLTENFFQRCPNARNPDGTPRRFLLYLGRLHRKKGADLLLDAFAFGPDPIAAREPNLDLVIAGPLGEPAGWGHRLRRRIEASPYAARIHWPGLLRDDAKWGAFTAAEAFILPSHQENFGIAVVEALGTGCPVLTTHPVNISPEIEADASGLIEADTPKGIRRLLDRWLALDPAARAEMRRRARSSFQRRYDINRNAEAILRTLQTP
jgi:glycosyltransferase involved in cell wall biosynthesis